MAYEAVPRKLMDSGTYTFARTLAYELVNVYTLRMAGDHDLDLHTRDSHRDVPALDCVARLRAGAFSAPYIGRFGWAPLVFPMWALVISVYVLFANFRARPA